MPNQRKAGWVPRSIVLQDAEWAAVCDLREKTGKTCNLIMREAVLETLKAAGVGVRRGRGRDDIRQLKMFRESQT